MTQAVGLQSSIWSNNLKSLLLLVSFPLVLIAMYWSFVFAFNISSNDSRSILRGKSSIEMQFLLNNQDDSSSTLWQNSLGKTNILVAETAVYVFLGVGIWFVIAWLSHQSFINMETNARPLERSESPRVYNLLENLCISRGLKIPKLFIIHSERLNAYASGINEKTYAITLTKGIINKLEDDELEAVIAHELSHIMNRDVRLLITSIIFVGIISVISEIMVRVVTRMTMDRGYMLRILIVIPVAAIGYFLSILIRFALSRRREYLADAGAVELTRNSDALIRALKKISGNSNIEGVDDDEVRQMMIDNDVSFLGIFDTHPPIKSRIAVLKCF